MPEPQPIAAAHADAVTLCGLIRGLHVLMDSADAPTMPPDAREGLWATLGVLRRLSAHHADALDRLAAGRPLATAETT